MEVEVVVLSLMVMMVNHWMRSFVTQQMIDVIKQNQLVSVKLGSATAGSRFRRRQRRRSGTANKPAVRADCMQTEMHYHISEPLH